MEKIEFSEGENGGFRRGKRSIPWGNTVGSQAETGAKRAVSRSRLAHLSLRNGPNDDAVWAERRPRSGRFAKWGG
ncbi:MAG: hypothetical protein IJV27_00775, partial [Prevotella sp.]|nr:hypothetical protein [Prevotella sp.]